MDISNQAVYPFDIKATENVPPDMSAPAIRAKSPLDPRDILHAQYELEMLKLRNGQDSTVERADTTAAKSAAHEAVVSSIHAAHGSGHAVLMQNMDRKLDALENNIWEMKYAQGEMKLTQDDMKATQNRMEQAFKTDMANMQTYMANMQTGIANMERAFQADMADVQKDIAKMQTDIANMGCMQAEMKVTQDDMKAKQDRILHLLEGLYNTHLGNTSAT